MKQVHYLAALSSIFASPIGVYAQHSSHHRPASAASAATVGNVATSSATSPAAAATSATSGDISDKSLSTTSTATSGSQWCIDLSGSIDFYYTLQPPWGTSSGKGPYKGCFADNANGGAIFIGTEASPQGGNTKLECTFNANQPNCDISLVDGYSVSLACTAPGGIKFGSDIDLWSKTCPDVVGSTCKNAKGYAPAQSDVASFFQPAYPDYWIWVNGQTNKNDPTLSTVGTVSCTVSHGKPSSKKAKREDDGAAGVALGDVMEPRGLEDLGIAKRHAHRARAHSRGLREYVGALKV